jgi:hypothetical protein
MIDPSGKTQLNLAPVAGATGSREDDLFRAVRDVVAGEYELLGELGRGANGSVVYLAREVATRNLVALKLERGVSGADADYELSVVPQLDESIPSPGSSCPYCGRRVQGWERFCPQCGRDISGEAGGSDPTSGFTTEELLVAVRESASDQYEVLGEMPRARGGGRVYFARDLASGAIVALRLQRDRSMAGDDQFSLGRTQVLKPIVADMGAQYASPTVVATPAAPPPPRQPAPSVPPAPSRRPGAPDTAPSATTQATPPAPTRPRAPDGRTVVELAAAVPPTGAPPGMIAHPPEVVEADVADTPTPPGSRRRRLLVAGGVVVALAGAVALTMAGGDETGDFKDTTPPADTRVVIADTTPPQTPADPPKPEPVVDTPVVRPARTVLIVTGDLPAGATISVDGRQLRGRRTAVTPGSHLLVARADGFAPFTQRLAVAGDTMTWSPRLQRIVRTDTGTRVVVDTTPKAPSPTCARSFAAQDWTTARTLCRRDAGAGDHAAQRLFGLMLLRGNGAPADEIGAVNWLRMAADADDAQALYELGRVHQTRRAYRDDRRAYDLFRRAALRGNADAQVQAGRALERGIGTSQNYREAFLLYEQAAKSGHAAGQNAYGVFLKKGLGTRRDDVKALEWLMKAAQGGSPEAHFHIGEMHEQGRAGLPRSRAAAVEWYRKGAALGSEEARRALRN